MTEMQQNVYSQVCTLFYRWILKPWKAETDSKQHIGTEKILYG